MTKECFRNKKGQFINGEIGKDTRFTSEMLMGNQFAKGNPANKTSFKKGNIPHNYKGGIQETSRDGVYIYDMKTKTRQPRSRVVWEKVYGKLPKGFVIYHLDGNRKNDNINNLKAVTRKELLFLNKKWS